MYMQTSTYQQVNHYYPYGGVIPGGGFLEESA